ncbi:MAG: hypothetical protein KY476_00720 [Planctomycetes bacterium]|nr:hypothetical protein [Planctomycetota bacterium]
MPTHRIVREFQQGSNPPVSQTREVTASGEIVIEETIPDASTDLALTANIDVSALKSLYISSDQDITLETNSGAAPADTINLKADSPLTWDDESSFANPLTVDLTALFATNASGAAATLKFYALQDATP